uniref:Uncharacterized protein n=1 Tax=Chromera velia CCMP2878 TaxID=1169474 RepID=A0A0G4HNT2_9ALVE|eukprot:Cvel_1215.t1-p1 / transcript=Cvel_1215.t1 / gene=Cvel_1215 / organism=Chromera_velia_CCMP2878 / gene_product=Chlorophyll a-b binding protein CP24, chloroplastic, putative / transcript_product=Chlorophyll a-b binding protein CP24, chloroplastic, putative / location=Cvel_scaffold40:114683-119063(+) / protein_length=293 / sequence_SO=supercontig / SO=protein_coding / is_pseudo=false
MRLLVAGVGSLALLQGASAFNLDMQFSFGGKKKPAKSKKSAAAPPKPQFIAGRRADSGPREKAGSGSKGADYLKEAEPAAYPRGAWYIVQDPEISKSAPWVKKEQIYDGTLAGDYGFDPLRLSERRDAWWMRTAELKHGRIAMLACVGLLTPELILKPEGFKGLNFVPAFDAVAPLEALRKAPPLGILQIALVLALIEFQTLKYVKNPMEYLQPYMDKGIKFSDEYFEKRTPGSIGFDPAGFADNGIRSDFAEAEIKHARLAMVGAAGMLIQSLIKPDMPILEQTSKWAAGQL